MTLLGAVIGRDPRIVCLLEIFVSVAIARRVASHAHVERVIGDLFFLIIAVVNSLFER